MQIETPDTRYKETALYGWKPEIIGAVAVCLVVWFLFAFARGF